MKGRGRFILGKKTVEELDLLRVGLGVYLIITEGSDSDICLEYKDVLEGVGKFKGY